VKLRKTAQAGHSSGRDGQIGSKGENDSLGKKRKRGAETNEDDHR
jgi:hypothetical protein